MGTKPNKPRGPMMNPIPQCSERGWSGTPNIGDMVSVETARSVCEVLPIVDIDHSRVNSYRVETAGWVPLSSIRNPS